jgi:hypothetical protein
MTPDEQSSSDADGPVMSENDLRHVWAARWEPAHAATLWRRIAAQRNTDATVTPPPAGARGRAGWIQEPRAGSEPPVAD